MGQRAGAAGLVGRSAELAVLRTLVAAVAAGQGGQAWVEGEPGIGKSALVAEGLAGAADLGCVVLTGAADGLRGRFPLGVMMDCLEAGDTGEGELKRIAGLLRGEGVAAGNAVMAAAEGVLGLVDRLCGGSPVVLVVDDLQWADEVSVSVWHRLAAGVGQVPLLVVAAARPVPLSPGLAVVRRGVTERGGEVLSLRPLLEPEVAVLVGQLVGARAGPGLLAQARQAGGNPLYVRELADALVREDRVQVRGGLAEVTSRAAGGPVSLAAAIEERLGFVSAGTLEVLRAAALLGARFSVRDLRVVAGRGARELAGVVGEAVAAGVLVESGLDLAFRHGLIQQALVGGMPAGMRAELHREAAWALAEAGAAAERVAAQLLAAGGELDEWMTGWLAGSAGVLVHRVPRAAADLLARAVGEVAAGDPRREVLMEHLAGVLLALARYDQAEPVARELLAGTGDPDRRARMAWTLASTLMRAGRPGEALEVADQALVAADPADASTARLRAARALALEFGSDDKEADAEAARALADAEQTGDRFAAGYALHVQSTLCSRGGDQAGALALLERALAVVGDDLETTDLRLLLLINRAGTLFSMDADAGDAAGELLTLAERVGTARLSMARCIVGEILFHTGHWDDALAELDAVLAPGADVDERVLASGLGIAALIAAHRDDRNGLTAHLSAAEQLPDLPDLKRFGLYLLHARAAAAERDGRPGQAAVMLAEAFDGRDVARTTELEVDLARCALAAGDRPAAEAAAARCEHASQGGSLADTRALARRCRGLVDTDPRPLDEAVGYYRAVTRPLDLGQALEDLAVVHAMHADLAAARARLGEAAAIYAGLGAEWDLLRADSRLRPYGVRRRRPGRLRPQTGWAALTMTETKVAFLVAQGLSNPEIGTRLFLSRYTVQVHVSRILAKLQVRSRVEVAGQLARQHPKSPPTAERSTA